MKNQENYLVSSPHLKAALARLGPLEKLVLQALLLAVSLILTQLEHSIPSFLPGLPSMSWGLANLVILFALLYLGPSSALLIVTAKVIFTFLTRGLIAGLLSCVGSFLAFFVEWLLVKYLASQVNLSSVSALGGISHMSGQVLAYGAYAQVNISYLIFPCALWGLLSGLLIAFLLKKLIKLISPLAKRQDFN